MSDKTPFDCSRLEEALREEDEVLLTAARAHAEHCATCRAALDDWFSFTETLSATARELHTEWESPELWTRIDKALPIEMPRRTHMHFDWRVLGAAAAMVTLAVAGTWIALHPAPVTHVANVPRPITQSAPAPVPEQNTKTTAEQARRHFLTEEALKELEANERAYVRSIDKLQTLAKPTLDQSAEPLLANYREKINTLDAAIADLRDARETNRLNARLNTELMALYQQKQQTLREVLEYASQRN